jgi:hypothetical protein
MFKRTLQTLRLEFPDIKLPQPPKLPFPQLLVAQPVAQPDTTRPENVFVDLWNLQEPAPQRNDAPGTPIILPPRRAMPQEWEKLRKQSQSAPQPLIWVVSPYHIPSAEVTPLFNIAHYFSELVDARGDNQVSDKLGRFLLYGEAVTSTHTQLIRWVTSGGFPNECVMCLQKPSRCEQASFSTALPCNISASGDWV